ncbi:hypothetical protein [Winogradskya humida]|uniref:Uncharacterized protein n=1 Tax=Winogradskya humida TaxID=113566 RepID=A0ABQ4A3Z5_9ACTN|nr:hypothetical protein [Actinoplanes humidus]GIE25580.1 hypothetical protein Ahu01nite_086820 [Actinoplanes humidus]
MTDEQLDRMIAGADPYRSGTAAGLGGADRSLLEEIVSQPVRHPFWARRGMGSGLAAVGVAAAVLAVAVGGALLNRNDPVREYAAPSASSATSAADFSAMVLKAAERNPRLLIGEPGWTVTNVNGFADDSGSITFTNGEHELGMDWSPAELYPDFYQDRLDVSEPVEVEVAGTKADIFTYSKDDFAVMLHPRGTTYVEMRTSSGWTRAQFEQVIADVKQVDVQTWLAAMPPEIVTPDRVDARLAEVLTGVPVPPGFSMTDLSALGTNDAYQFGGRVTGRVGCGWIHEWIRAKKVGDQVSQQRAAAAMSGSHHWKVLNDMNAKGDWPEVFWEYADQMAAGKMPEGYESGLGCE